MPSAGSCLREMRLRHGVSLDEIARSTRVASRYLAALEADDFSLLPPPVFTRGFIRAYCQVLGESAEEVLALYGKSLGRPDAPPEGAVRRRLEPIPEPAGRGRSAVLVSFILLVGLGLALVAVTIALQGGSETPIERRVNSPAGSPATVLDRAAAPAARPRESAPGDPAALVRPDERQRESGTSAVQMTTHPPYAPVIQPPAATGPVVAPYRLVARASELTWIRVRTADGRITEGTIQPGETREWTSNGPFRLIVGNAGGLTLELNGQRLPPLGARGAVIREFALPRETP